MTQSPGGSYYPTVEASAATQPATSRPTRGTSRQPRPTTKEPVGKGSVYDRVSGGAEPEEEGAEGLRWQPNPAL